MAKKATAKAVDKAQPAPALQVPEVKVEPLAIQSLEQLDLAMKEWAELNAKESSLSLELKTKVNDLKLEYQKKMVVTVDGKEVTIEARRTELIAQIKAYSDANKLQLLPTEKKSRELTHGTISWRASSPRLVDTDAVKEGSVASAFIESLLSIVRVCLRKTKVALFPGLVATDVVTVTVTWNNTLLFERFKAGDIKLEQLKAAGFDVTGATDSFSAKPTELMVKTEATPPPQPSEKP